MDYENNKESLKAVLLTNDEEKIQDFLLRYGKKKSYCPIYIKPNINIEEEASLNNNIEDDSNKEL